MCKCSKCVYGDYVKATETNRAYYYCAITGEIIDVETSEDDHLGCELYADLCNDDAA